MALPSIRMLLLYCLLGLASSAFAADDDSRLEEARDALLAGNLQRSIEIWNVLAGMGNAEAQYLLATQLARRGDSQALAQAAKWFQAAAEQGHARAQFSLAQAYETGAGVDQNNDMALN